MQFKPETLTQSPPRTQRNWKVSPGTQATSQCAVLRFLNCPVGLSLCGLGDLCVSCFGIVPVEEALRIKDDRMLQLDLSMEATRRNLEYVTVLNPNPMPKNFAHWDLVTFDDSFTNGTVSIIGSVTPRLVTVSNVARAYSFAGGSMDGDVTSISMTYQ